MYIIFGAYCHECSEFFDVMPAEENIHTGLARKHSKEYEHTCIVYKKIVSIRNGKSVSDSGSEVVVTFLRGEKV